VLQDLTKARQWLEKAAMAGSNEPKTGSWIGSSADGGMDFQL
jgi:TPR repeat protein